MRNSKIAGSIATKTWEEFKFKIQNVSINLIEHRLDSLQLEERKKINYSGMKKSIIATCRSTSEGGKFSGSIEEQYKLLKKAILNGANIVDIELDTPKDIQQKLVTFAHKKGVIVIISKHYIKESPPIEELIQKGNLCNHRGANIVKIVTSAFSMKEIKTILKFQLSVSYPCIAFTMGKIGSISRVVTIFHGAPFTYASLEEPTAEGQLSVEQMETIFNILLE